MVVTMSLTAVASIRMETWSSLKQERKGGSRWEVISPRECSCRQGGRCVHASVEEGSEMCVGNKGR